MFDSISESLICVAQTFCRPHRAEDTNTTAMNVINLCDDEPEEPNRIQSEPGNSRKPLTSAAIGKSDVSRRKSEHQPLGDDEIEIIEDDDFRQYNISDNPNLLLMQKIAKIRILIQQKIRERNLSPLSFDADLTFDSLLQQYREKVERKRQKSKRN